ncbi:MAG: thiol peroxidase [Planctomycetota bacterium]
MATTNFKGTPVHTVGDLPRVGGPAPAFTLVQNDLSPLSLKDLAGQTVVLNIFPSIDTGTCATSVRKFNEQAASFPDTVVVCVSMDLPFAQKRFCGAEGIDRVRTASAFRGDFGASYGVTLKDGPLAGLFARAVVVIDGAGKVTHVELVPEIANEPDYRAVVAAVR